jgi:flavin-binding protein dodecin
MSVVKIIEIIGESHIGWEDAARVGLKKATETIENICGVEVTAMTAKVENNELTKYRATMKVAFVLKDK